MEAKFINTFAVKGNRQQLEDLAKSLEDELEYKRYSNNKHREDDEYLIVNLTSGAFQHKYGYYNHNGGYEIQLSLPEDKDLALSLAAMREGNEFHIGEYITKDTWNKNRDVYKIIAIDNILEVIVISYKGDNYYYNTNVIRKATTQEIINHFKPQQTEKQDKMEQFSVSSNSQSLRKAFIEELQSRGFIPIGGGTNNTFINEENKFLNPVDDKMYSVDNKKKNNYILPQDWDKALQAFEDYNKVKEVTIEVPFDGGTLEFIILGKDITVKDGMEVDIDDLETVINNTILSWGESAYPVISTEVAIGCHTGIKIADLKRVLNKYNEINS